MFNVTILLTRLVKAIAVKLNINKEARSNSEVAVGDHAEPCGMTTSLLPNKDAFLLRSLPLT